MQVDLFSSAHDNVDRFLSQEATHFLSPPFCRASYSGWFGWFLFDGSSCQVLALVPRPGPMVRWSSSTPYRVGDKSGSIHYFMRVKTDEKDECWALGIWKTEIIRRGEQKASKDNISSTDCNIHHKKYLWILKKTCHELEAAKSIYCTI